MAAEEKQEVADFPKSEKLTKKAKTWVDNRWRPMMGWVYMVTCIFDFIVAPILWSVAQIYAHGSVTTEWHPLTLQNGGLYHLAMGTIVGVTAYGRTKEKIEGKE